MAKSSVWHCRKHKHVFDKTRFWDHLHLVTRIETAVGLDLVVNRPKVKRFGSWCSALGKIRPIIFPAPRKCYSVSVPNWGTSKKNYTNLSEAQKQPRYWKKCLLPPSVFFRQREHGKLDGRRISIAEGLRHHGIDGVLLRAQHTGLNHRFGRHRRIFGRQILGNPEPPRAPPQELHELHHSKWWVNPPPTSPKDPNSPWGSTSALMRPEMWNHFQSHFQGAGSEGKPAMPRAHGKTWHPFRIFLLVVNGVNGDVDHPYSILKYTL